MTAPAPICMASATIQDVPHRGALSFGPITMTKCTHLSILLSIVCVGGCGGASGPRNSSTSQLRDTCAIRLPVRDAAADSDLPTPRPALSIPQSTLVADVEVSLKTLQRELETHVPRRVVEKQTSDIGVAGRLEYTVDRGPMALRMEGDVLAIESPLRGNAEACAKGRCYAGCNPEARVVARVPLRLSADYRLRVSDVRIDITRGCKLRALGGLVSVDVTPMVQNALSGQARTVQASIDRQLPDFRPAATRLWDELSRPRSLPLGACATLKPEGIVQGVASGTSEFVHLPFGVLSRPELHLKCETGAAEGRPSKLPPLRESRALPKSGDIHLAIVLPPDAPARAIDPNAVIDLGGARARIARSTGDVQHGLTLELAGEACGEVTTAAVAGASWLDSKSVHLTGVVPQGADGERLKASRLEGARLAEGIERTTIPLPIALDAIGTMLPELTRGLEADEATVQATVESAEPEIAGVRGPNVLAVARLRGRVTVQPKRK